MKFASMFIISLPFKKITQYFSVISLCQPCNDQTKKEIFLQMREQKQNAGLYDCSCDLSTKFLLSNVLSLHLFIFYLITRWRVSLTMFTIYRLV